MMHRFSWLAALLVLVIVSPLMAQANPSAPPASDVASDSSAHYRPGPIAWQPCPENAAFACGTLTLPVDYAQPRGESFELAVIRAPARAPQTRIGVLMLNPGGPGNSGVDFVLAGAGAPAFEGLRQGFDVVSFDVRGSHRSRPVQCQVDPPGEPPVGNDEALVAFFDDFGRRFAETCLAQAGPFIRTMSVNTIARDMDVLRRALGERQISYAGISFGTTLGAVYASLFPRQVRAMLLDSGVMPEFQDSLVEFAAEQTISFELTLQRLDQLCRKDAACRLREGGVVGAVDELRARLDAAPMTGPDGVVLDGDQLKHIVTSLLQFDANWPLLVRALADGREEHYALLFQLVPFIANVPLANTPFFAIKCNSYGTRRSAAEYLAMSQAVAAVAPRTDGDNQVASVVASCTSWPPADPPVIRNVQPRLDHPILFLGTDFDPNTPFSWTRRLAFALGAEHSIVRYQGGGHTIATRGTACIGGIVVNYLFNLVVPPEGTTCPARPLDFGSPAQLSAAQTLDGLRSRLWQDMR